MVRALDKKVDGIKPPLSESEDFMKPKDFDVLYEPIKNRLIERFGIDTKEAGRFAKKYIREKKASQKSALVLDQFMKDGTL